MSCVCLFYGHGEEVLILKEISMSTKRQRELSKINQKLLQHDEYVLQAEIQTMETELGRIREVQEATTVKEQLPCLYPLKKYSTKEKKVAKRRNRHDSFYQSNYTLSTGGIFIDVDGSFFVV